MTWTEYAFQLAEQVANKSKDPQTKCGCVILGQDNQVLSTGYNGFPFGVDEPRGRWTRPEKYRWVSHAERNAIYLAARSGTSLKGSRMYVSKSPMCGGCAIAAVQAGIDQVYLKGTNDLSDKWDDEMSLVEQIFSEAGVELEVVDANKRRTT